MFLAIWFEAQSGSVAISQSSVWFLLPGGFGARIYEAKRSTAFLRDELLAVA